MKQLLRVIAIDDGYFKPKTKGSTILVGVVSRLDGRVEGILTSAVKVDALDSTNAIAKMVRASKFDKQAAFVLLSGLNFAGFNIVDLPALSRRLGIPCIAVMRKQPNMQKISAALSRFRDNKKRMALIKKAGEIHKGDSVLFQFAGTDEKTARMVLRKTRMHSNIPEP
ncbi:MAG: DUF99 family protein, partial [Candidatus Diapherotrites archaeon]|nr:DUF99 family protein [Candidatus Diapherotrites archaeon]